MYFILHFTLLPCPTKNTQKSILNLMNNCVVWQQFVPTILLFYPLTEWGEMLQRTVYSLELWNMSYEFNLSTTDQCMRTNDREQHFSPVMRINIEIDFSPPHTNENTYRTERCCDMERKQRSKTWKKKNKYVIAEFISLPIFVLFVAVDFLVDRQSSVHSLPLAGIAHSAATHSKDGNIIKTKLSRAWRIIRNQKHNFLFHFYLYL